MKPMTADELRRAFLGFFEAKGHTPLPSSSLVPNDPSLLLTTAGMVQFKPYMLGEEKPPWKPLTDHLTLSALSAPLPAASMPASRPISLES